MENEFSTLQELYNRISPALKSKVSEFRKYGYKEITESDIWNYLTDKKWKKSKALTLYEMVEDIFSSNGNDIIDYMISKVSVEDRKPDLEDI